MFNSPSSDENATLQVEPQDGHPAEIKALLEAMLPGDQRIPPIPNNLMALAILADKYDVKSLLIDCERSLKYAHEISFIDRLVLADRLHLKSVLIHLANILSASDWKEIIDEEEEKFDMLSGDFMRMMFKQEKRAL